MAPESVEEFYQFLFCSRILRVFEYYAIDPGSEVEEIEDLIRALLNIMLKMPGYVYAADTRLGDRRTLRGFDVKDA